MEEKLDTLYQEYLYKKLDSIISIDENQYYELPVMPRENKDQDLYGYTKVKKFFKYNYKNIEGKLISDEWFYDVEPDGFKYGYAWVEKDCKYNYINTEGKLISDKWFDGVENRAFQYGYAWVEKDGKCNYINTEGKLISDKWFDNGIIKGFKNGYAWVEKDDKYNYINTEGKLISDIWFNRVEQDGFKYGYAWVRKDGKYNYINTEGKLISDIWFGGVEPEGFKNGYALVEKFSKYNYINTEGKLISDEWIDGVEPKCFKNGYALVKKFSKYNYKNREGKLISDEWFDDVEHDGFNNGYAWVKKNGKCNYINIKGKLISSEWFDAVEQDSFKYGCAWVKKDDKYNYINREGKLISSEWFHSMEKVGFKYGYAWVRKDGKYNYINREGKLISDKWFDGVEDDGFKYGCGLVMEGYKWNYINTEGKLISTEWFESWKIGEVRKKIEQDGAVIVRIDDHYESHDTFIVGSNRGMICGYDRGLFVKKYVKKENDCFMNLDGKILPIAISLGKYSSKRNLFGYEMDNGTIKFNIKYKPIKTYGERYVLCFHNGMVYIYDRFNSLYKKLGSATKIAYDDNFIFDYQDEKVYFVYDSKIIDITKYYREKLEGKKGSITITSNLDLIPREDFYYTNSEEIDRRLIDDLVNQKKNQEEQERIEEEKRNNKRIKEIEKQKKLKEIKKLEAIRNIELGLKQLEEYSMESKIRRIESDALLIEKDDHYEFRPFVINHLRFFDLSLVHFQNVKIEGIDFRDTNVSIINLLKVYNKSFRNCNFEGIYLPPFINLEGIDIRGCRFSEDYNSHTVEVVPDFSKAIYDDTTTYNGEPVKNIINGNIK